MWNAEVLPSDEDQVPNHDVSSQVGESNLVYSKISVSV